MGSRPVFSISLPTSEFGFNHGSTRINTDEELAEGRSGLIFRRPPNGALSERLKHHV
jgi:hypothetical protein